jgi:hypothetical protein
MLPNHASAWLQPLEGMLQVAMADCGGSYHERTIGNRFGYGFEFLSVSQQLRSAHRGSCVLEGHLVWIHYPQMEESKIAHCPGGGADVEGIARVHQDHAQTIEFSRNGQARNILRHSLSQSSWQIGLYVGEFRSKPFAVASIPQPR